MPGIVLSMLQTLTQLYLIITLWGKDYHDLILQMRKKLSHRDTGSFVQGHKAKKRFSNLTPESPFCLSILPHACLIGISNLKCPEWTLDILPMLSSPLLSLLFKLLYCVWHFATPWTIARQAKILEWAPFPSPGDLPNPGTEPMSPALAGGFYTTEPPGKPHLLPSLSS